VINVQQFLKRKGIGPNSTTDEILQFVPSSIVLRMWPDRVHGELGADAQGGYVAFSIFQPSALDSDYSDATYLIVMRLTGEIESVKIFETGDPKYGAPRIDGLKARRLDRAMDVAVDARELRRIEHQTRTWGRANTGVVIVAPSHHPRASNERDACGRLARRAAWRGTVWGDARSEPPAARVQLQPDGA